MKHEYKDRPTSVRTGQQTADVKTGQNLANEAVFLLDGSVAMVTAIYGQDLTGWHSSTSHGLVTKRQIPLKDPALPFTHWVIIDRVTVSPDKKDITCSLWTWHHRADVKYRIEFLTEYIREAVFIKT